RHLGGGGLDPAHAGRTSHAFDGDADQFYGGRLDGLVHGGIPCSACMWTFPLWEGQGDGRDNFTGTRRIADFTCVLGPVTPRERPMKKIIVGAFTSLDGVMQAPGGPDEDPTGGFRHGGWAFPFFDEEMGKG